MGGRGAAFVKTTIADYKSFPVSLRLYGGKYATPEEKKLKTEIVTRFMNEAKIGNVYSVGAGFGSSGAQFEVVSKNKSPNKMGLRWIGSNGQPVVMSRANVASFIANGAHLIKGTTRKNGKQ